MSLAPQSVAPGAATQPTCLCAHSAQGLLLGRAGLHCLSMQAAAALGLCSAGLAALASAPYPPTRLVPSDLTVRARFSTAHQPSQRRPPLPPLRPQVQAVQQVPALLQGRGLLDQRRLHGEQPLRDGAHWGWLGQRGQRAGGSGGWGACRGALGQRDAGAGCWVCIEN